MYVSIDTPSISVTYGWLTSNGGTCVDGRTKKS